MSVSLYIHIPFCRKRCPYCDFYSTEYDDDLAEEYVEVIIEQLRMCNDEFETIYIGGGTPSVLSVSLWEQLLSAMNRFIRKAEEVTVEVNPESANVDKLKLFLDYGVNRLSVGVQSFSDDKLKLLGRLHTTGDSFRVIDEALSLGFENISIDLIYGVWGKTLKDWENELRNVQKLEIKHISCYSLTLEPSTPFYKFRRDIDEEVVAKMYMFNMRYLPRCGFFQYEVSNFAKRGWECKHNINYWMGKEYVGVGPAAVSFVNGERIHNISSVKEYIRRWRGGESLAGFTEKLSPEERARELAAVQIRTVWGINFARFQRLSGFDFLSLQNNNELRQLIKKGLLRKERRGGKLEGISLTRRGFLFSDEVSATFV